MCWYSRRRENQSCFKKRSVYFLIYNRTKSSSYWNAISFSVMNTIWTVNAKYCIQITSLLRRCMFQQQKKGVLKGLDRIWAESLRDCSNTRSNLEEILEISYFNKNSTEGKVTNWILYAMEMILCLLAWALNSSYYFKIGWHSCDLQEKIIPKLY